MSLTPEQYLSACAASQMLEVVPALDGSYAGGTAGTVGALLMMAVQDLGSRTEREAAEFERLKVIFNRAGDAVPITLHAARDGLDALHERAETGGDHALTQMVLDHYVVTTEMQRLTIPV